MPCLTALDTEERTVSQFAAPASPGVAAGDSDPGLHRPLVAFGHVVRRGHVQVFGEQQVLPGPVAQALQQVDGVGLERPTSGMAREGVVDRGEVLDAVPPLLVEAVVCGDSRRNADGHSSRRGSVRAGCQR